MALVSCLDRDKLKAYALLRILSVNCPADVSLSNLYSAEISRLVDELQKSPSLANTQAGQSVTDTV